jgi:hypothetical protein
VTAPHERTVAEVLRAAADLIEPEGKWTQRSEARTVTGRPVGACEENAACWCILGAVQRVGGRFAEREVTPALKKVIRFQPWIWNDHKRRTQAEVVAKLREAAALAEAQSPNHKNA